jgi:hypothetical protein
VVLSLNGSTFLEACFVISISSCFRLLQSHTFCGPERPAKHIVSHDGACQSNRSVIYVGGGPCWSN